MTEMLVRHYRPPDEEAVRRICGDTALYGQTIERLIKDRESVVDALIGYYTEFETESLLVADHEGEVVGYLAGCVDTKRFERLFSLHILPRLIARFVTHGHWHRALSWRVLAALGQTGHERQRILRSIVDAYPAHCHMNIAAGFRRRGVGALLFGSFLRYLVQRGARGIHVSTATEAGKAFFLKKGFTVLGRHPTPRLPVDTPEENWLLGKELLEE